MVIAVGRHCVDGEITINMCLFLVVGDHRARYSVWQVDPVAPVAYQVILEPGIGQFGEFEPRRVHIRVDSLGLFLVDKLTCGKRESVS